MINMLKITSHTSKLFSAQSGLCFHCDKAMLPHAVKKKPNGKRDKGWTREHLIPKSKGGGRGKNIVLAHAVCNAERGNEPPTVEMVDKAKAIWRKAAQVSFVTPSGSGDVPHYDYTIGVGESAFVPPRSAKGEDQ